MKKALAIFLFTAAAVLHAEDPFPPVAYPPDRYASMKERSPFVLPTIVTEEQVQSEWTNDYRIVSVLQLGEESVVLAKKISTSERIPIRTEENQLGIRLVSIQLSPDPNNVSAVITMGGQEGTIRYDETILSQTARPAPANNPAIISE